MMVFYRSVDFFMEHPILGVILIVVASAIPAIGGMFGYDVEKAVRPKTDENPMRRDDW